MIDSIVLFPHCRWEAFPYQTILEVAGRERTVYVVTTPAGLSGAPSSFRSIARNELHTLPWMQTAAIVTHPCWIYEIAGRAPAAVLALLPEAHEYGDDAYLRCRDALCAAASMIVTSSEPLYFEQWFRRCRVFLRDGLDLASDAIADAAIMDAISGKPLDSLAKLQLQRRQDFREEQLKALRPTAMQSFFQAVYQYLLGGYERAEHSAKLAFEQAVFAGDDAAVITYFRFLSAIRLQLGNPLDAIATYGISAVTDAERNAFATMSALQDEGQDALAAALLLRMNEDYRQAAELLEPIEEADRSGLVRSLLFEVYSARGKPDLALSLIGETRHAEARTKRHLLEGTALALQGKRHEAIHAILQAAMHGAEPLQAIAELAAVDQQAQRLSEGDSA